MNILFLLIWIDQCHWVTWKCLWWFSDYRGVANLGYFMFMTIASIFHRFLAYWYDRFIVIFIVIAIFSMMLIFILIIITQKQLRLFIYVLLCEVYCNYLVNYFVLLLVLLFHNLLSWIYFCFVWMYCIPFFYLYLIGFVIEFELVLFLFCFINKTIKKHKMKCNKLNITERFIII